MGYNAPGLDACGGHAHTATGNDEHGFDLQNYHYHVQIFQKTVESGEIADTGEVYLVSTTGPYQCFKADITAGDTSSARAGAMGMSRDELEATTYRCCGMTDYYAVTGCKAPPSHRPPAHPRGGRATVSLP